jgi:hypothetical protein
VLVYLAGPLFSDAERAFLADCAARVRAAGLECFVPHEQEPQLAEFTPRSVFDLDYGQGVARAHALVAWLDGPQVDDGTAAEVGLFYGLMQSDPWRKGILGLATDQRFRRRPQSIDDGGLNFFLAGLIERSGGLCWSLDDVIARLLAWQAELQAPGRA